MYHISKDQFKKILQQHMPKSFWQTFGQDDPFPLNAMSENIGEIYRTAVRVGKPYTPSGEFDVYAGLIDENTVLVINYDEYTQMSVLYEHEIYYEEVDEDEKEYEDDEYSYLDSCEVLKTWVEINPLNSVWFWLGI